ncbi:thioesterase family protein [Nocardioides sp. SYSU D00038]|uniref:thioesterase family protein n=1 Tax=Nocardioides sp. SYSU D00038 TaxID=2812554 RepID=UPI0019678613|nr:acyl-CoA thioesterase [Nocardioides sp. SYSU D00038]
MRFRYECPTRWADMDVQKHVNNVVYADYLQEARVAFFREAHVAGRREPTERPAMVVSKSRLVYREPLEHREAGVAVELWLTRLGAASFALDYEVFTEGPDGRRVHASATTEHAAFDLATNKLRRISPEEDAALRPWLDEPEEPAAPLPRLGEGPRTEAGHYPVQVRWSDLDPYRHVNNVKFLEYFQEARLRLHSRLWHELPPPRSFSIVVAQADLEYVRPMFLRPEPYDVWSWVSRVGERSYTIEAEISDGERAVARSRVVVVCVDPATGRATHPDPVYLDALRAAAG